MQKPWIVLGSGPSRAQTPIGKDMHVATCNAGFTCPGIKAYGVIHRGHRYGTLDTIHEWDWSDYRAVRKPQTKAA